MKVAKTLLRPEAQQAWAFAGLALSIAGALAAVVPANAGRRKAEQEWMAAQKRRLAMERQELPPLPTRMAFSPSEPQEPARIVSLVRAMASVSECRLTAFELSTTGQRDAAAMVWPERIQLELTGPFPRIRTAGPAPADTACKSRHGIPASPARCRPCHPPPAVRVAPQRGRCPRVRPPRCSWLPPELLQLFLDHLLDPALGHVHRGHLHLELFRNFVPRTTF